MIFFGMGYQASREELAVNATVKAALTRLGLLVKQAAFLAGVAEGYLRDALNGRRPLKFSRLHRIEGFDEAYMLAKADEKDFLLLDKKRVRLVEVETHSVKASWACDCQERKRA
jgi:hypothetical protein